MLEKEYLLYRSRCSQLLDKELKDYTLLNDYENFKDIITLTSFNSFKNASQSRKNKRNRTSKKISEIMQIQNHLERQGIDSYMVFGTLTLTDKILATKENTYIRKIHNYLKEHYVYVILNKDFGATTEREHYHFIGLTLQDIKDSGKRSKKGIKLFNLVNDNYNLGFSPDLEIIDRNDLVKTRNYLLKLNNHSNKITTHNSRTRIIKNADGDLWSLMVKKLMNINQLFIN